MGIADRSGIKAGKDRTVISIPSNQLTKANLQENFRAASEFYRLMFEAYARDANIIRCGATDKGVFIVNAQFANYAILMLAIELAIKALIVREGKKHPTHHKIDKLIDLLSEGLKEHIFQKYRTICAAESAKLSADRDRDFQIYTKKTGVTRKEFDKELRFSGVVGLPETDKEFYEALGLIANHFIEFRYLSEMENFSNPWNGVHPVFYPILYDAIWDAGEIGG